MVADRVGGICDPDGGRQAELGVGPLPEGACEAGGRVVYADALDGGDREREGKSTPFAGYVRFGIAGKSARDDRMSCRLPLHRYEIRRAPGGECWKGRRRHGQLHANRKILSS